MVLWPAPGSEGGLEDVEKTEGQDSANQCHSTYEEALLSWEMLQSYTVGQGEEGGEGDGEDHCTSRGDGVKGGGSKC